MKYLEKIRQEIRNSTLGKQLSKIERWSKFRSDESTAKWIDLLGPTAIVLSHQEYFVDFILSQTSSQDSELIETLALAGSIHDLGEAVVGDTANPEKTDQTDSEEYFQAILLLHKLNLEPMLITKLEDSFRQAVIGENQIVHHVFKALERTEYLDTAVHLFSQLSQNKEMKLGHYMIARILSFDLPKIIDFAITLPEIIGNYLQDNADIISQMFIESKRSVETDFEEQYNQSLQKWNSYLKSI